MERMRILVSSAGPLTGQVGGGQVYVQNLARELRGRGYDVHLVAPARSGVEEGAERLERYDFEGIPVTGVAASDCGRPRKSRGELDGGLLATLSSLLQEVEPDVVHINGWKAAWATTCRQQAVPHVITAHHPGIACPAGALLTPDDHICDRPMSPKACVPCHCTQLNGGGRWSRRLLGAVPPMIYRPLGGLLGLLSKPPYAARALMYPCMVERAIRERKTALALGRLFIAPSRTIAQVLVRNGAAADRIRVVPHGIRPLARAPLDRLGHRPVRFGYVGQINRAKGLHILFRALASIPQHLPVELHIFGAPQRPHEDRYLRTAMDEVGGDERIRCHGAVPHSEIGRAMTSFDVLVLPAIYLEVFGLIVLEALSAGRPVIATDCGGPAETIRHGVDGLLVPPNDPAALAQAMAGLAEHPERILAMAHAIQPVRTLAEHVDAVTAIYQEVASGVSLAESTASAMGARR